MNSHSITGPLPAAAGVGVHVLSTAPNVVFFGGTAIEKFAIGFETDAANTVSYVPNGLFGNRGVVLNGPNGLALLPIAEGNLHNGIVLTSAAGGTFLYTPESISNAGNGIVLNGTTGVTANDTIAFQNAGYGLWLKGASFNSFVDGDLEGNIVAGAYLGCHAGGPSSGACAIPPSNNNNIEGAGGDKFIVGSCPQNSQHPQELGIAIDAGNSHNHVIAISTSTNGSCGSPGDTIDDGFDGNGPGCFGNFWSFNSLTKENHTPSAAHPFCMD